MRNRTILSATVLAFACALPAGANETNRYGLSVVVDGSQAPEYPSRGRVYVEALKGRHFTLRVSNPTGERVAVALSVDGRNVVDARRTTAREATKWLLEPWQTLEIPGWQISGDTSRRFFFTETARSYARWLGDTSNVGTIEAVFFREKRRPVAQPLTVPGSGFRKDRREASSGQASGAAGEPPAPSAQAQSADRDESTKLQAEAPRLSDSYAATGIGERSSFPVTWVDFQEDPSPVATITLRYEFRPELVRLGVLSQESDLWSREKAAGFERKYAPSPER